MQTKGEVIDGEEKISTTGRHGSYGVNSWLGSGRPEGFLSETSVHRPATTPLISDCISLTQLQPPLETDSPAPDLINGEMHGMGAFTIPRHGGRPNRIPTSHPPGARLPGAINMSFYDGSVAHTPLEKLWQLTWHRNWIAPDRRPGL
jgi:prepilin-type processing-associated H-X9-DG protein